MISAGGPNQPLQQPAGRQSGFAGHKGQPGGPLLLNVAFGGAEGRVMNIRRAIPTDRGVLVDIWLRSVRATHTFLSEEDMQSLLPPTRDYLTSDGPELWILCTEAGVVVGFMGMSG